MAEAVLSFFVQKLGEQLVHEVELLTGVHDDVVWIRNELQTMRAFLKDADRRKDREELVEAWITQVRYSVFNAEDAVDEFMIRMDSQALSEQVIHEVELLTGVHDDVEWIRKELQTIRAFLKDADQRKEREEVVAAWITQVRYLVFNAEDAVDEFMIRMESQRGLQNVHMGCILFQAFFIKHLKVLQQNNKRIQKIRKEVKEIQEIGDRFGLQAAFQEGSSSYATDGGNRDPGVAASWVEEADIVGLENYVMKLGQLLLREEEIQQRAVISIVGMGGLGKTTLAKRFYRTATTSFDCHAWIYVSQSFQKKNILKRMLEGFYESRKEAAPNHVETLDETNIAKMINDYLQGKRYALFLDDIWDTSVWEDVKHALPHEGGSKIIFTTRSENRARPVHEKFHIHKVKPLSYELAWELFQKKVFLNQDTQGTCPQHLVEVGNAMVKRCKGLPLAIVVIGGLMSKKSTDPAEWNDVLENLDSELKDNEDLARLNRALLTSYNYLPFYLKYCFLYCGLFPEDYVFKRKKLIRMWLAEGFIEEHPRKTPEEVSSNYFAQLIDRNLLQPVIDERKGELKACQVHDLMRDVAVHMFKKEEFAAILTSRRNNFEEAQRRLAIQNAAIDIPRSMPELNTRSLLVFNDQEFPSSSFCRMFSKFKFLRVLDLEGTKIKILPNEVGGLIHLRYLSLRRTQIEELPVSLQRLHNLQTLEVRDSQLKGLPTGIDAYEIEASLFKEI
ncbi:putative disease resistance protein At1g50180 [Magnolia sinica]|uniref:putative disease resistance protein At1g50180 n=1 Tax=Magnolia sinica TaxID=86752 RepID=UPI002657AC9C|nr:putative disease resistance protein At1g50180 [Magnolia sinica]